MYLPQGSRRSLIDISVTNVLGLTGMIVARDKLAAGMLQKQDGHPTRSRVVSSTASFETTDLATETMSLDEQ